jgi:hypothetical protein
VVVISAQCSIAHQGNKKGRLVTHGGEAKRVDVDTEGSNVLLFEFTSQVTLDKGGLR